MAEREVKEALVAAKFKIAEETSVDEMRQLADSMEENPFYAVNLKIARGELTTGNPLGDFVAMTHGMDSFQKFLAYYKLLDSEVRGRSEGLMATIVNLEDPRHIKNDSKKARGFMYVGSIKGGEVPIVNLNSGQTFRGVELVNVYPTIEIPTDFYFSISFPRDRKTPEPSFYLGGSIRVGSVSNIKTPSIDEKPPVEDFFSHFPRSAEVIIGSSAVKEWFRENKMDKVWSNIAGRMPQNVAF